MDNEDKSEVNNTLQSIRDELREVLQTSRKQHREYAINKSRIDLEEIHQNNSSFSEDFVYSLGIKLKSKALPVKEYRILQHALLQSVENINAFLRVNKILYSLVRDIKCTNSVLQLCSAHVCANISLGNAKACQALGKYIIPYFIVILESLNFHLMEACAFTIGNLVAGCDKNFEILRKQGCTKNLILQLKNSDENLFPAIVYASLQYMNKGYRQFSDEEIMQFAEALISRVSHKTNDFDTMWLLAILSSRPCCTTYFLRIKQWMVDQLWSLTFVDNVDVAKVIAIIRMLSNVVQEPTGQIAQALLSDVNRSPQQVQSLFDALFLHSNQCVRKESLWLAGNLYNFPDARVNELTKAVILPLPSLERAVFSVSST